MELKRVEGKEFCGGPYVVHLVHLIRFLSEPNAECLYGAQTYNNAWTGLPNKLIFVLSQ